MERDRISILKNHPGKSCKVLYSATPCTGNSCAERIYRINLVQSSLFYLFHLACRLCGGNHLSWTNFQNLRKSAVSAVVTSSVLFSITHIINALSGQSMADTILQLIYALLLGSAFALLMLKNGNIVPLISCCITLFTASYGNVVYFNLAV